MEVWLWSYFGAQGQKPDGLGFRLWGFRVFLQLCNLQGLIWFLDSRRLTRFSGFTGFDLVIGFQGALNDLTRVHAGLWRVH